MADEPALAPSDEVATAPEEALVDPVAAATARSTRRVVLVALVVLGLASAGLGVVWQQTGVWKPSWSSSAKAPLCPTGPLVPAAPAEVKVNVYNASEHVGKASKTAQALERRGFRVGTVTNAELPDDMRSGVGSILAGPDSLTQALAIQRQVPGALIRVQPERTDGAVDLVLGEGFGRLVAAGSVDSGAGQMRCERPLPPQR